MREAHDCNFHEALSKCINERCVLHRAMRTLAKNLRDVATAERAYRLGKQRGWYEAQEERGFYVFPDDYFEPGSGRAAR